MTSMTLCQMEPHPVPGTVSRTLRAAYLSSRLFDPASPDATARGPLRIRFGSACCRPARSRDPPFDFSSISGCLDTRARLISFLPLILAFFLSFFFILFSPATRS